MTGGCKVRWLKLDVGPNMHTFTQLPQLKPKMAFSLAIQTYRVGGPWQAKEEKKVHHTTYFMSTNNSPLLVKMEHRHYKDSKMIMQGCDRAHHSEGPASSVEDDKESR